MMLAICCCWCFHFSWELKAVVKESKINAALTSSVWDYFLMTPAETPRQLVKELLLICLLLVGPFGNTHRQRVFFCWDEGFLRIAISICELEMKTRQFNQRINNQESAVIKIKHTALRQSRGKLLSYLDKRFFLMQTLNDLLTEALTYNWAHYLNIQHGRDEE